MTTAIGTYTLTEYTTVVSVAADADPAILLLSCGHVTTVPLDDEESLSFLGAEFECDRHGWTH